MKMMTRNCCFGATAAATLLLLASSGFAVSPAPHNPALHYRADFFDYLPDGAPLTGADATWLDLVNSVPATSFGTAQTIEKNEAGPQGHSVVRDNSASGNNQWWVTDANMPANLLSGTNDYTMIAVIKSVDPPVDANNIGIAGTWGPTTTHQNQWYLSAEPDVLGGGYQRTFQSTGASTFRSLSAFGLTSADISQGFHSYGWVKSGGATPVLTLHTDGISAPMQGGIVPADLGTNDQGGFGRRLNFAHSNGNFKGDMAEIIFWDYALSASQLADVDAYLNSRYVIPEPSALLFSIVGFLAFGGFVRHRRHS